jgi:hypothetical protein
MDEKNKQEPTVQEEAGLGPEWKVVNAPAITPSQPGVPSSVPNPMAPYFGGSISPTLQHDAVFVGTKYGTFAIPSLPLMPLSASGQPTVGSAVQSGSTTTIETSVNAVAAGPNGAVQFNNGGALGGSAAFLFNSGTISLTVNATVNITGSVTITGSLILTGTIGANIFNATTGFQIGGAAASGKYLRGNGTNFVSATLSGSDVLTGLVGVTYGGTGSDLSATGGPSEVLRQSSVGGAVTVSQLAASDLSNGTTGTGAVVLANAPTFTANPVFASSTGTGAVVLADSPTFTTMITSPVLVLTGATPTTIAGQVGFGTTTGFGTGAAGTAVTTTTKGGGTGPTTPQTVVNYIEIDIAGTKFWIPLVQ